MDQRSDRETSRPEEWTEGSFARDTLIHALGSLTTSLLEGAFIDADVRATYRNWIAKCEHDPTLSDSGERLVTTGLREGRCMLVARGRVDEFCMFLDHTEFRTLVAAGFDVKARSLAGVCIAKFEGDMNAAIRFSRLLDREIRARSAHVSHHGHQWLSN